MSRILVTGGTGFVGSHCLIQLLQRGHEVRTTVRNLKRETDVRAMLKMEGIDDLSGLSFFAANLDQDEGWAQAVADCEYVLHIASPFPPTQPQNEEDLIRPAREGTLRVMRAARDAGVKRVVVTSSFAAIGYGQEPQNAPFTEKNWTNLDGPGVTPYVKSKTLAERAAWDFIKNQAGNIELTVINPVGIFGPVPGSNISSSAGIIKRMLEGSMPAALNLYFGVVDVRDVAALHIIAMTHPEAKGERFLASAGDCISMHEVARILRRRLGENAKKAPRFQLPDPVVRLVAKISPTMRAMLPELGKVKHISNEKARSILGWEPRSSSDAIVATGESLLKLNLVKQ